MTWGIGCISLTIKSVWKNSSGRKKSDGSRTKKELWRTHKGICSKCLNYTILFHTLFSCLWYMLGIVDMHYIIGILAGNVPVPCIPCIPWAENNSRQQDKNNRHIYTCMNIHSKQFVLWLGHPTINHRDPHEMNVRWKYGEDRSPRPHIQTGYTYSHLPSTPTR